MPRLLVPISVDALVVRPGESATAAATSWTPATRAANGPPARQVLAPQPFADAGAPRPTGVHLHWAVPDALAVLRARSKTFPALPCRWLVVRLDGTVPRRLRSWLLPNIHAEKVRVIPEGHTAVHSIGTAASPVSVRGRGPEGPHPAWALGYDDTVGRLAFHDPLDDAGGVTGPLAYAVIGWYTHTRFDPLTPTKGRPATPTWLRDVLARLRWEVDLPPGLAVPTGSVYHGYAVGIGWPDLGWPGDGDGEFSTPAGGLPDATEVTSGLGDTLVAAVGALLDGQVEATTSAMSEAILAGGQSRFTEPDGAARLDADRHQARFLGVAPQTGVPDVLYQEPADHTPTAGATPAVGTLTEVTYPKPRQWQAGDPVLALAGLGRSLRHGGDGRFNPLGLLDCRVTGQTVTTPNSTLPDWNAASDVPGEVGDLLCELAALDPGSAPGLTAAGVGGRSAIAAARASWWTAWSGDWTIAPQGTQWNGALPSPVALTRPSRPWNPLRLDWQVAWTPTPTGPSHWTLGDLDFEPAADFSLAGLATLTVQGSGWLSAAPAHLLASAAAASDVPGSALVGMADAAAASLEGFLDRIRGVPPGSWVGPKGIIDVPPASLLAAEQYAAAGHVAGIWQLSRLRVVDTFGQCVDLLTDRAGPAPAPVVPEELTVAAVTGLALRPRFTAPASMQARFLHFQPGHDIDAGPGVSPLGGFLLPSPMRASVELVDETGQTRGELCPDPLSSRTVLRETPGAEGRALTGALAVVAEVVVGADRSASPGTDDDSALATLMQVLATTRAAVDATGRVGDGRLGVLLGNPVAVLRLGLTIAVEDPQAEASNAQSLTPVRLGSIGLLTDGVLAWILEDDPTQVHPVHPGVVAAMRAIWGPGGGSAPTVLGDPLVWLSPDVTRSLIVLAVPDCDLTVVSGLLPQKRLEMMREWTDGPLRRLTPTLGYDAVLRDPAAISLPLPAGVPGDWTWYQRPTPGQPYEGAQVSADPPSAQPSTTVLAQDGYLRVTLAEDPSYERVTLGVECISRGGPTGSIQFLGGTNPNGSRWRLPMGRAVEMVQSGRFDFVVRTATGERSRRLEVGVSRLGRTYLHTPVDESALNNLEELPRCP